MPGSLILRFSFSFYLICDGQEEQEKFDADPIGWAASHLDVAWREETPETAAFELLNHLPGTEYADNGPPYPNEFEDNRETTGEYLGLFVLKPGEDKEPLHEWLRSFGFTPEEV